MVKCSLKRFETELDMNNGVFRATCIFRFSEFPATVNRPFRF